MLGQGGSGGGLEFGQRERKAQHATERSGVKCGAWSGGCPNSPRRGGLGSLGFSCCFRGCGWRLIDHGRRRIAEPLMGPPVVVAVEPVLQAPAQAWQGGRILVLEYT